MASWCSDADARGARRTDRWKATVGDAARARRPRADAHLAQGSPVDSADSSAPLAHQPFPGSPPASNADSIHSFSLQTSPPLTRARSAISDASTLVWQESDRALLRRQTNSALCSKFEHRAHRGAGGCKPPTPLSKRRRPWAACASRRQRPTAAGAPLWAPPSPFREECAEREVSRQAASERRASTPFGRAERRRCTASVA